MDNFSLSCILIEEQISNEAKEIFKALIDSKDKLYMTIFNSIKNRMTKVNFDIGLNSLIKNEFIYIVNTNYAIKESITFEINNNNILNVLYYPRYLYLITLNYGKEGADIFEKFLQYGILSVKSLLNKFDDNKFNSKYITMLKQMIEDGVLIIRDKPHKIKVDMKKIKLKENNCDSINEIKKNSNYFNESTQQFFYFSIDYSKIKKVLINEFIISNISLTNSLNKIYTIPIVSSIFDSPSSSIPLNEEIRNLIQSHPLLSQIIYIDDSKVKLNEKEIASYMINHSLEKIFDILYTTQHVRVFRYFTITYSANINQISEQCSINQKVSEGIIKDLIKEKIIVPDQSNKEYSLAAFSDGLINHYKSLIYEMIYKIKVDLNDKLKSLSLTVSPQMQEEYINKAFSIIHTLNEIILSFTYYNKINS